MFCKGVFITLTCFPDDSRVIVMSWNFSSADYDHGFWWVGKCDTALFNTSDSSSEDTDTDKCLAIGIAAYQFNILIEREVSYLKFYQIKCVFRINVVLYDLVHDVDTVVIQLS